ncbi:hypothetical protein GN956_G14783 [Arapaima gigas]
MYVDAGRSRGTGQQLATNLYESRDRRLPASVSATAGDAPGGKRGCSDALRYGQDPQISPPTQSHQPHA